MASPRYVPVRVRSGAFGLASIAGSRRPSWQGSREVLRPERAESAVLLPKLLHQVIRSCSADVTLQVSGASVAWAACPLARQCPLPTDAGALMEALPCGVICGAIGHSNPRARWLHEKYFDL